MLPLAAWGRPLVRNIRSTHEFDRLLKKHSEETGLPVIVDFYSDSCGPCRMMAPIFQKVAKQYLDKAVFVKIDTNAQYELSGRYQVRSLPTFSYFLGGKKAHQAVGGIGEQGLQRDVDSMVRQAEAENVILSLENLRSFYQEQDAAKEDDDIVGIHKKCVDLAKSRTVDECVGAGASQLARKLKKKYKSAPKLTPRFSEEDRASKNEKGDAGKEKASSSSSSSNSGAPSNKPNLHLATLEQLQEELEKRMDEERDAQVEGEDPMEQESDPEFHSWTPSGYPEKMVVVGGGPAGWSAAIYGARAGLAPLVIAPSMGGQLAGKGVDVENYPGLAETATGPALVAAMRRQALHFGATVEDDVVTSIGPSGDNGPIQIQTNTTGLIEAHTVILATGAEANWLDVPGEWEMRGGGVSSCATCDGFLYAKKSVIVVGGGDAAMEDALVLARTSSKVTVIHRRDQFRASKVLADRVLDHPVIEVVWNTTIQEILGEYVESNDDSASSDDGSVDDLDQQQKVVKGAVVRDVSSGETRTLKCDAVFVAIGHTPNTSFLKGVVDFDASAPGYVQTMVGSTVTSLPGLFAAGDVADAVYRQAITSAGSGAAAALDAERYLSENGLGNEQDDLEAELLAELMGDSASSSASSSGGEDASYNVYADDSSTANAKQFARESVRAEL